MSKIPSKIKSTPNEVTSFERMLGVASYTAVCVAVGFMMGKSNPQKKQLAQIEQKLDQLERNIASHSKEPASGSFWERMEFKQTIQNQKLSKIERDVNKFMGDMKYKQDRHLDKQQELLQNFNKKLTEQAEEVKKLKAGDQTKKVSKRVSYPGYNSKARKQKVKYFFGDAIRQ